MLTGLEAFNFILNRTSDEVLGFLNCKKPKCLEDHGANSINVIKLDLLKWVVAFIQTHSYFTETQTRPKYSPSTVPLTAIVFEAQEDCRKFKHSYLLGVKITNQAFKISTEK